MNRYLQNKGNGEPEVATNKQQKPENTFTAAGYSIKKNNYKCSNLYLKEFQRDVSCINIILRSECKASNKCKHLQNETNQIDQKSMSNGKENLTKKYLEPSNIYVSRFDLLSKNYTLKYEDSTFNHSSKIPRDDTSISYRPDQQGETLPNKNTSDTISESDKPVESNKVLSSKDLFLTKLERNIERKDSVEQVFKNRKTNMQAPFEKVKETKEASVTTELKLNFKDKSSKQEKGSKLMDSEFKMTENLSSKICSCLKSSVIPYSKENKKTEIYTYNALMDNICNCKNSYEKYETLSNHEKYNSNRILLQSQKLKYLPTKDTSDVCTNATCTLTNHSTLNTKLDNRYESTVTAKPVKHTTKNNYLELEKSINKNKWEEKPSETIDNTLDMLQTILEGVEKLNNKVNLTNNIEYCHCEGKKCKSMYCSYKDVSTRHKVAEYNHSTSALQALTKPECTKILMEIREQTKAFEEQLVLMNKHMKIKRKMMRKQQRDTNTQIPEKKNVCVQNCSHNDINYAKYVPNVSFKVENNSDLQQIKQRNKDFQQFGKNQIRNQTEPIRKEADVQVNIKHGNNTDSQSNSNTKQRDYNKHVKDNDTVRLNRTQSSQNGSTKSASFIFNEANYRPLATSTPRRVGIIKKGKSSYPIEEGSLIDKSLEVKQVGALTQFLNHPANKETVIVLFLTRSMCSKHLKSKYKKFEFMNFKPKCIVNSCDQRLIRYQSLRRKSQIFNVFKQLESVNYKVEKYVDTTRNNCDCIVKRSINERKMSDRDVSDLLATVCTQSSDLYITTATSTSCVTLNSNNNQSNLANDRPDKGEACILC